VTAIEDSDFISGWLELSDGFQKLLEADEYRLLLSALLIVRHTVRRVNFHKHIQNLLKYSFL
jgi:hypothetical protein